jgi:predicted transglutaminase-like cysteine proteinase
MTLSQAIHRAFLATIFSVALNGAAEAQADAGKFMPATGPTSPPVGFVQFCRQNLADCTATYSARPTVALSRGRWDQLVAVNRDVNQAVQPMTDQENYGVAEYWTYPTNGRGDCEDYVLEKRRRLIALGWPAGSLLITVVRDTKNDGHAVLTALTDKGDYILDNQNTQVLAWNQTEYRYIKRQSPTDTVRWEGIDDRRIDYVASTGK